MKMDICLHSGTPILKQLRTPFRISPLHYSSISDVVALSTSLFLVVIILFFLKRIKRSVSLDQLQELGKRDSVSIVTRLSSVAIEGLTFCLASNH